MMKLFLSILCLILFCTGCMPLTQQDLIGYSHEDFHVNYDNGSLIVGFPGGLVDDYEVLDEKSFVIGPDKAKYKTFHENTNYGTRVFIKDDEGKTIKSWPNGVWVVEVVAKDREGLVETYSQEFKLWTFYYSPFIHGAPN